MRKKCHSSYISSSASPSPASRTAASPVPTPYQPGHDLARLRPAEHPRDRAQPAEPGAAVRPPRRPRADVEVGQQLDRRRLHEVRRQVGVLDQARGRPSCAASGQQVHHVVPPAQRVVGRAAARGAARSPRASPPGSARGSPGPAPAASTCREMTSPCSVTLISPSRVPHGCARIASWVGPPPRPTVPPRPWKSRSRTPWRAATSRSCRCARWISHWRGRDARLLVGVGVAEHDLLHVAAQRRPAGGTTGRRAARRGPARPRAARSTVSSSGTKPIRATPRCRSTSPASRASSTAASTSSAPRVIETM